MSSVFIYRCTNIETPSNARAAAEAKAKLLGLGWIFYEERPELARLHWQERPRLAVLLRAIQRGDHLIVYQLEQLTRNRTQVVEALSYLGRIGVTVHVLNWEGKPLELDEVTIPTFTRILSGARAWVTHTLAQHLSRTKNACKVRSKLSYGRRRTRSPLGVLLDVWCPVQCDIIREVMGRKNAGETWKQIARDFYERKVRDATGHLWCPRGNSRVKDPSVRRIQRMLLWYQRLLKGGGQLGA